MKKFVAAAVFIALVIPVAVADEAAAKKLNGSYQVLSLTVGGKPDDKKKDRVSEFLIKDGTIEIKEGSGKADTAKFTVDATKKPAHIDLSPGGNENMKGIYETKETDKGLELTLAFPKNPTSPRPKDFKGEGPDDIVVKLLRKK
jgi:uncharacterized protein (TIGR03067 family)